MRKLIAYLFFAVVATVAVIGIEVVIALRRDYLPTEPVLDIGGRYGDSEGAPLRFVVLGDSTAAGIGALDADRSYPVLLAERLAARLDRPVELTDLGISGARVGDLLETQVPEAVTARPDLVFIGIGANDVTHVTPLDDVRTATARVLERLETTDAIVVVAGAPDMRAQAWPEPLRTLAGWRGRQVASAIGETARGRGVEVVPLAEKTGRFFAEAPERHYSADDFHPGPRGYARWADAIEPVLLEALSETSTRGR